MVCVEEDDNRLLMVLWMLLVGARGELEMSVLKFGVVVVPISNPNDEIPIENRSKIRNGYLFGAILLVSSMFHFILFSIRFVETNLEKDVDILGGI